MGESKGQITIDMPSILIAEKKKKTPIVEFSGNQREWNVQGDVYRLRDKALRINKLENAVYMLSADDHGFYLEKIEETFAFDYKLYGLEKSLIARTHKTYMNSKGNLGVLLNGVKGTGKTVTAKLICNAINIPVILVNIAIPGCHIFLNGIPQDITIFIDEYEKVFKEEAADMLTIMDGALNSEHRRMFMLTTNKLHINENLIQRPGRIRYLKTFSDLQPDVIEEIITDRLKHKAFKDDLVKFISNLEIITVDVVNSIIDEVNIHNESPTVFKDVFNVKKISGKFNILLVDEATGATKELYKNTQIYPRKVDGNEDEILGYRFECGGKTIGRIVEVIGKNVLRIQPEPNEKAITALKKTVSKSDSKEIVKKKIKAVIPPSFIIRVEDADITNWKYKYGTGTSEYSHLM